MVLNFRILFFLFMGLGCSLAIQAQNEGWLTGKITDEKGLPVGRVNIVMDHSSQGTSSNDSGFFKILLPAEKEISIGISMVGYQSQQISILMKKKEKRYVEVTLIPEIKNIDEISIRSDYDRSSGLTKIDTKNFQKIPNPSGNFESLLKTLPGVSSTNELSSQYSVRGGNFDENLVYVNDIEISRPFLIRSGQQEGLSFINPDMVSSVKFSAGGFEARYGDKLSSVLDVTYRRPIKSQVQGSLAFLGANVTGEGCSQNGKLSFIAGARYKSTQYLLNTLDTKGDYKPSFSDFQALIDYQVTPKLELSFLGNYAQNQYDFVPQTRSTNFGTINEVYNLTVYYGGKELDKYRSSLGALILSFHPSQQLSLKLIASGNSTYEQETFDIDGQYLINELDNTIGSTTNKDSLLNLGVGGMLNHARNYLWNNSFNLTHFGQFSFKNHKIRWSVSLKNENIHDRVNEWTLMDSAGYAVPYSETEIVFRDVANANNTINSTRISGFIQDAYQFSGNNCSWFLNGGVRVNYYSFNREFLISPRIRLTIKPDWFHPVTFHFATGIYDQPPSYKEMRDFSGTLHPNVKAQKSIHFVAGSTYLLSLWNRPFVFTSELYYKNLSHLIPYKIDNVRTRYSAENNAKGYAYGIDFKLNGEFVPGVESWASLSLLKTEADIMGDSYTDKNGIKQEPGYFPLPTDQRVNFCLFFQDYLPNNPTLQLYLNLVYGSSIHVSPPEPARYDQTFPIGPYRRVDLGISKIIKNENLTSKFPWVNKFKELLISCEIFNLLNINNKASFLWVKTVSNQENMPNEFAVPNYLTSRRLNIKFYFKF